MRRRRRTTLAASAAALAVLAGACTSDQGPGKVMAEVGIDLRLASALRPFDACGPLLDHVRTEAAAHAASGQLAYLGGGFRRDDVMAFDGRMTGAAPPAMAEATDAAAGSAAKAAAPQASGTNIQEAGVDEPDVVKTDGRRIVTVTSGTPQTPGTSGTPQTPGASGRLQVLVVEDGKHRLAGALPLPGSSGENGYGGSGDHDLLLAGDRVLVRSSTWSASPRTDVPVENGRRRRRGPDR